MTSLSTQEQQALDSIMDDLAGCDPALVARLAIFTRLASGEEMPARERVQAGSRRVLIDDFRAVQTGGKTVWKGRQDKGHRAEVTAFRQAITGGPAMPTETMLATMRATIQAAGTLGHD